MARGFEGVKADLSELGQQILGLARLFRPLFGELVCNGHEASPSPTHTEGPNPYPCPNLRAAAALRGRSGGGGGGVREEILQFTRELIASPELDRRQSEILSTDKPVEEMQDRHNPEPQPAVAESSSSVMKEEKGDSEQEVDQSQVRRTSTEATKATTPQYLDNWFDTLVVLRETDASTETRQLMSNRDDDSYSEQEEGDNVILLKRNRFSRSIEAADQDHSLISSNQWLRFSQNDHDQALEKLQGKMFTRDKSDWHKDRDNLEYEFV